MVDPFPSITIGQVADPRRFVIEYPPAVAVSVPLALHVKVIPVQPVTLVTAFNGKRLCEGAD